MLFNVFPNIPKHHHSTLQSLTPKMERPDGMICYDPSWEREVVWMLGNNDLSLAGTRQVQGAATQIHQMTQPIIRQNSQHNPTPLAPRQTNKSINSLCPTVENGSLPQINMEQRTPLDRTLTDKTTDDFINSIFTDWSPPNTSHNK